MEKRAIAGIPRKENEFAMWFLLMLVILLTNGMSAFGLKMIAGWGLPDTIKYPYLTVWYAGRLGGDCSAHALERDARGEDGTFLGGCEREP